MNKAIADTTWANAPWDLPADKLHAKASAGDVQHIIEHCTKCRLATQAYIDSPASCAASTEASGDLLTQVCAMWPSNATQSILMQCRTLENH